MVGDMHLYLLENLTLYGFLTFIEYSANFFATFLNALL